MNKPIEEMKIYSMRVEDKQVLVDIIEGRKKLMKLLLTPDNERECVEMEDPNDPENSYVKVKHGNCIPIRYDALRLSLNEEYVTVKIRKSSSELIVDDNNQPIVLKEFGEDYLAENVTYLLGQILETNVRYQKFFENYMDDLVVREDEDGNRYKRAADWTEEVGPCPKDDTEAWEGESFGYFHVLSRITEEEYWNFGKTWRYGVNDRERVKI